MCDWLCLKNSVLQLLSPVHLFATPWTIACQSPPLSPGVCSYSCPLSQWRYLTILSSVVPFFCLQSFPASGTFTVSWLFASGGQSIGASASALPMNIQGWFYLGLSGLSSLQCKGLQESHPKPQFKSIKSLAPSLLYGPVVTSIHDCWKNYSFDYTDLS